MLSVPQRQYPIEKEDLYALMQQLRDRIEAEERYNYTIE